MFIRSDFGLHHSSHCDSSPARSRYFGIFPVEVFGSGPKTTLFGTLKRAMRERQKSHDLAFRRGGALLQLDVGAGRLAPLGSGCATTAASITAGCPKRTSSTSCEEMFSPPWR